MKYFAFTTPERIEEWRIYFAKKVAEGATSLDPKLVDEEIEQAFQEWRKAHEALH
jgi:hypothetical protein